MSGNENKCPTPDELSSFFDKETPDAAIAAHVESCPTCRSILKSYERINHQIQDNLRRPTQRDMGILVRIKDESLREIRKTNEPIFSRALLVRMILGLVTIGGLLYLIHHFREVARQKRDVRTIVKNEEVPVANNGEMNLPVSTESDRPLIELANKRSEDFGNVELLALGVTPDQAHPSLKRKEMPEVATTQTVRQTWNVDDAAVPLKFFRYLLKEDFREDLDELVAESAGRNCLILILSEARLQQLVTDLADLKFRQLTADGPKPGGAAAGTHLVRFEVSFVGKE